MSEWISIKDKYPEKGTWVLCATNNATGARISAELFYDGENDYGHHWLRIGDWDDVVTHWMPLPEPPKGLIMKGVSRGHAMPQTIEAYKDLAQRDLELIESQRDEISRLKCKVNDLQQKLDRAKTKYK